MQSSGIITIYISFANWHLKKKSKPIAPVFKVLIILLMSHYRAYVSLSVHAQMHWPLC